MNTNKILTLLFSLLLFVGCDYNDKYFEGYDDIIITDLVQYEGEFTGNYPSEGYFTDRTSLVTAINTMLTGKFKYCDEGSSASIKVLYGDIIPGYQAADISYELTTEDYDSMGEESGQPGNYDNFDSNMDIDSYLIAFLKTKYPSAEVGQTISIIYKFYASGVTSTRSSAYKNEGADWTPVELGYTTDLKYTLEAEDYESMGTENGKPGRYGNFDANMDIDHYLINFLRIKFPYSTSGQTAEVIYKYYANNVTHDDSRIYKYDGLSWIIFNPYEDIMEVTTKIAEMEFDGSEWVLKRLMGGTTKLTLTSEHYQMLYNWVKENKSEYIRHETEEYYFGAATGYNNLNNNYNTWRTYYNINGDYDGLDNDAMQAIMDERLAFGIINILLPIMVNNPDSGLTYTVVYKIYGGRGDGNYKMSFIYNEESEEFELVSGVTPE